MIIDPASETEWNNQKDAVIKKRDEVKTQFDNFQKNAVEKGWSGQQYDRRLKRSGIGRQLNSLNNTLNTMSVVESSSTIYKLQSTDGKGGSLSRGNDNSLVINFSSTGNFVHEITHAGQYERQEIGFNGHNVIAYDIMDEVFAYQAQFAYSSDAPVFNNISWDSDITESWVRNIVNAQGMRPYSALPSFPITMNSTRGELIKAYPKTLFYQLDMSPGMKLKDIRGNLLYKR
jgi:hypothetical protein